MPSIQVSIASGKVRIPWPHTSSNDAIHPAALAQMSTDTLSQLLRMFTSVLGTWSKRADRGARRKRGYHCHTFKTTCAKLTSPRDRAIEGWGEER